jgi:hypothetical protein
MYCICRSESTCRLHKEIISGHQSREIEMNRILNLPLYCCCSTVQVYDCSRYSETPFAWCKLDLLAFNINDTTTNGCVYNRYVTKQS